MASRLPPPAARNRMSSRTSALPTRANCTGRTETVRPGVAGTDGTAERLGSRWAGTPTRTGLWTATSPPASGCTLPAADPGRHDHHGIVCTSLPNRPTPDVAVDPRADGTRTVREGH